MVRVVALAVLAGCGTTVNDEPAGSQRASPLGSTRSASPVESTRSASPTPSLGSVPGFGISDEEVVRDDTLAYWEAYSRDRVVQDCMAGAGFEWQIEAPYPEAVTRDIADSLGVTPVAEAAPNPQETNRRYVDALRHEDADNYYRALYGVDAQRYADAVEEQRDPAELGAGQGCARKGADHGRRVWELRDDVEPTARAAREEYRDSTEAGVWRSRAQECANEQGLPEVVGEEELDEALAAGSEPAAVQRVEQECRPIWGERLAAEHDYVAEAVWDAHGEDLEEQRRDYAGVMEELRADEEFLAHLGQVVP